MRARHASVSITYAQANITSEVKEDLSLIHISEPTRPY